MENSRPKGLRRITVNVYRVTALASGKTWEGVSSEFPNAGHRNNGCPVQRSRFSTMIKNPESSKLYKVEIIGRREVLREGGRECVVEPIKPENDRCYKMKNGGLELVWMKYEGAERCARCFLAYHEECEKAPCQADGVRGYFRLKGGAAL